MKKRHYRLKKKLEYLGFDIDAISVNNTERINAVWFLASLLHYHTEYNSFPLPGYHFKWYDGPHSSTLVDKIRELKGTTLSFESELDSISCKESFKRVGAFAENKDTEYLQLLAKEAYRLFTGQETGEHETLNSLGFSFSKPNRYALACHMINGTGTSSVTLHVTNAQSENEARGKVVEEAKKLKPHLIIEQILVEKL